MTEVTDPVFLKTADRFRAIATEAGMTNLVRASQIFRPGEKGIHPLTHICNDHVRHDACHPANDRLFMAGGYLGRAISLWSQGLTDLALHELRHCDRWLDNLERVRGERN